MFWLKFHSFTLMYILSWKEASRTVNLSLKTRGSFRAKASTLRVNTKWTDNSAALKLQRVQQHVQILLQMEACVLYHRLRGSPATSLCANGVEKTLWVSHLKWLRKKRMKDIRQSWRGTAHWASDMSTAENCRRCGGGDSSCEEWEENMEENEGWCC